jgi:hypothetical protein
VTIGEMRATTIADADEKLFKAWHALHWCQLPPDLKVRMCLTFAV